MQLELSEEALEFGRQAHRAIESAGGDELVQAAEVNPGSRGKMVESLLAGLGAWDLDIRGSDDELEAAAALCRAAGWWAVAYPVAERLARLRRSGSGAAGGSDGLLVVHGPHPSAAIDGVDLRWDAVDLDGNVSQATPQPAPAGPRKTAFVTRLELVPTESAEAAETADIALGLVLPCWTLLGMMDRALALTRDYVRQREQFGQPLAAFQGVQFQMTDAEVERLGVEELAKYSLWSAGTGRPEALDDALALRLAAIEAADIVFRVAHQLHGAIGFCDETTLSWISRYSVPLRRLPTGLSATRDELTLRVGRRGLTGLFSHPLTTPTD